MKKLNDRRPDSRKSLRGRCSSWEWLVLRAMVSLGFALFALSPAVLSQTQMEKRPIEDHPQIVVSVFNDAGVDEPTIAGAEKTGAEIYEQAGLAILWKNCPAKPLGEAGRCVQATGIDHLLVHIERQPRTLAAEVYGVAFLAEDGSGVYCDVFYDRIVELHHRGRSSEARILGVVVAHELGHLLLGSHAHSPIGIMRPQLQARDFWTAELGTTTFSREQARRISDRLAQMRGLRHSIGSPARMTAPDITCAALGARWGTNPTLGPRAGGRQPKLVAFPPDAILDFKMACLHRDTDAVAVERQNTKLGNLRDRRNVR